MKSAFYTIMALIFSISGPSYAAPQMGDFATYDITVKNPDGHISLPTKFQHKKMEYVAYDDKTDSFDVRVSYFKTGQEASALVISDRMISRSSIEADMATVAALLDECESLYGGTLAKILVPAGSFETCVGYQNNEGTVLEWFGHVMGGSVRRSEIDNSDGSELIYELSMQKGDFSPSIMPSISKMIGKPE